MATAVVAESRYDPRCDTIEALDARLVACVRSGAPLRRTLARIAGAFVAHRAWEPLGFVRPADYSRERPGLSARELHDLARVDAALGRLPEIDAALVSGALGWTKARLLCRVATPEDEAHWLHAASRFSADALSREVRAIDVGSLEAGAESEPDSGRDREVVRVRVPRRVKGRWGALKGAMRRVAGERLPNDACVEILTAEVLSAVRVELEGQESPPPVRRAGSGEHEPAPVPEPPRTSAAPPERSPFIESLAEGLAEASPHELDGRLCRAATLERGLLARVGPLLLAFTERRGPRQLGFRSVDAYARERLGMSPRKARALLRLERACVRSIALGEAWRSGTLTVSRALALVPLVLAEGSEQFHAAWIQRAGAVTVRRLEDDVEAALGSGLLDPASLPDLPGGPAPECLPEGVQIGAEPMRGEETDVWVANVPAEVARLFRGCLATLARRLGSKGQALDAMFDHCLATWRVPTARHHRVFERDGWRCTAPGCSSQRNLHAHHVFFRSAGGGDELANLTTLCAAHHQRGVHAGVLRIRGRAPEGLVFETPFGRFRAGDRLLSDAGAPRADRYSPPDPSWVHSF